MNNELDALRGVADAARALVNEIRAEDPDAPEPASDMMALPGLEAALARLDEANRGITRG